MTREKMRDRGDRGIVHFFLHRRRLSTTWVGGMALVAQSAYSLAMPPPYSVSRCSLGSPVMFRWFGFPSAPLGADREIAAEAFVGAVSSWEVVPGSHESAFVITAFLDRMEEAERGMLRHPSHVKAIDETHEPPLFEMRWQGLGSITKPLGSGKERPKILMRMYYSEPSTTPHHVIGHHIHEKNVTPGVDIRRHQDAEINIALRFYYQGELTNWGIRP